jgi:hypothetical protein
MTEERENEIRRMSREQQEDLYRELMDKYGAKFVAPGEAPPMHDARKLAAAEEERELLDKLLSESE